jgi:hypothetical protein
MDLNWQISKSFDNSRSHQYKSTVFDATIEQAEISIKKLRPKQVAMGINRQPVPLRSSRTFYSTIFKPSESQVPKVNIYKPFDHSTADFFGTEPSDFYRKSTSSKLLPKFEPKYKYEQVWAVENSGFLTPIREKPKKNFLKFENQTGLINLKDTSSTRSDITHSTACATPTILPKSDNLGEIRDQIIKIKPTLKSSTPQPIASGVLKTPSSNVCLSLSGLRPEDSEFSIRELCKGWHIVSLTAKCDNLTGRCKGTADVIIKPYKKPLDSLKQTLVNLGYKVSEKFHTNGKKNNYADLASNSFLNSFLFSKEKKSPFRKYNLESSEDLFGSSPGVGRYVSTTKKPDKQSLVIHSWDKVKKLNTTISANLNTKKSCNYLRNTISSMKKYKKIIIE